MDIKLFNRWDVSNISVLDPGIKDYINLKPVFVLKSCGRHTDIRFHKNKTPIVERLMNKLMVPGHKGKTHKVTSGHCTGKSAHVSNVVKDAFIIIEQKTKKNPVEVFVRAIENSAPREVITTIEYGGARYPQAVECAPQRRVDLALRHMAQGAYAASFKKKAKIEEALANEIMLASNGDNKSNAVAKRLELERQAESSR